MAEQSFLVHDLTVSETISLSAALFRSLKWRLIGPYRGGRVVAVAGDPVDAQTFYFGSTGGGVWKTNDGGMTWENVSDGYFKRASVGAIAVAESDPNVIYVGMGESTIRGNVSHGDGVYKSTDKGRTWMHLGLAETRNIAKVRVHPHNPDIVYVAALGHAHGNNPARGVYRSLDGGASWQHVLYRSEKAGAIDLALDPQNPRIMYAAFWDARRLPHTLESGGEDSGIFKSSDGGETWTEITRNPGLPKGLLGKIGVVASPAQAGRLWLIVEAEDGAVFRSDDYGATWQRMSEERNLRQRAWYYHHIYADPQDAETLWVLNVQAWKSIDGGKTFFEVSIPHGDNHDLWIDLRNPRRMVEGNDGGACVSFNGGESWTTIYNQPTAEFYHVTTDNQVPYRVYGAQQDNTTICVASRSALAGITHEDCYEIGGGESGYIAVRPDNSNIVYAGNYQGYITRYDYRSHQARNIAVWPELASGWGAKDQKYRFQWTAPILLSPHDPNTLYITGNHVFRSTDEGNSWEIISPDLTRNDIGKQGASGGPVTKDNTGAEYYCTIFAFAESPLQAGLFWAGSDDGLVHISRDAGQTWTNITPPDLPEWALISIIEPSPHNPATAYVAATRYKLDDFQPYLFRTDDYGQTWTLITNGIRHDDFTRVLREDPQRRGLLYAGTETSIYVSFNNGASWQSLQLNLPVVPIHDLVIKDSDLIVATHGRAFWILDDITPLRQASASIQEQAAYLFKPRPTTRFKTNWGFARPTKAGHYYQMTGATMISIRRVEGADGELENRYLDAGENPPDGVVVYYYLAQKPEAAITLTFLDAAGNEIKSFSSKTQDTEQQDQKKEGERKEPHVPAEVGTNRFIWDMRYPEATRIEGYVGNEAALAGPQVAPGVYQVCLTLGEQAISETFEILADARTGATQADLQAQATLLLQIRDKLSETNEAINTIRSVRQQVEEWEQRIKGNADFEALANSAQSLKEQLTAVEEELVQVKAKSRQDTLNYPAKLNAKVAALVGVVASADAAPTRQSYALFADLSQRIGVQLERLQAILSSDMQEFSAQVHAANVPAIVPVAKK